MSEKVRSRLLVTWLALVTAGLVYVVAGSDAISEQRVTNFDEINVHRINIVEPDGKPRVIISNRERMAGLYWGGKEYKHHSRNAGGFLFYNDDGDEVGGMTFSNRRQGDNYGAGSSLLFDQYKQDQTLGLIYSEENRQRVAGLRVWDRPDASLLPAIELSDKIASASSEEERTRLRAEMRKLEQTYLDGGGFAERFFAGKQLGDSVVKLADNKGRTRLLLKVDAKGEPSVEFLDEAGKVVKRIGAQPQE